MARADTWTLLCIDDWARYMAIHPDAWNQVVNCNAPYPGACERVWIQNGWLDMTSGRVLGREDVANAIATAEEMIAHALGFWPAPTWIFAEEHEWPLPARGAQTSYPPIALDWGHVIEGGQRALTAIELAAAVAYYDGDGDGVNEMATLTITAAQLAAVGADPEEVAVYFQGETDDTWMVRCLSITEDLAGNVVIIGRASMFVDPDLWLVADDIDLCVPANFVTQVDVYRRWNYPLYQAQLIWKGGGEGCSPAACAETCQTACISIEDSRRGIVHAIPSTYSSGAWAQASLSMGRLPDAVRFWYHSGLLLQANGKIKPMLAEAIVRLANTYMVDQPCGCAATIDRWTRDREEQDINSYDAQLAMSTFGSTMKGAIFAWSVIKRIPPLVRGGALT
jgi:hypothetical protein